MRVGFVGLGRMGDPMVRHLAGGSNEVILWNRTKAKAQTLAEELGFSLAETPAELAGHSDVVITMLENEAAVRDVFEGENGLLEALREGVVAVDMSTVGPWTTADLFSKIAPTGASLVDAPVSGSVPSAEAASLLIMAAGDSWAIDIAEPVLTTMGSVLRMGESGSGAAVKLAINSIVFMLNQAVSELLVLTDRAGVDRDLAYTAFAKSSIRSPFIENRRQIYTEPGTTPVLFTNNLVAKDLRLVSELAERLGVQLPMTDTTGEMVQAVIEAGFGDADMGMAAVFMRDHETESQRPRNE